MVSPSLHGSRTSIFLVNPSNIILTGRHPLRKFTNAISKNNISEDYYLWETLPYIYSKNVPYPGRSKYGIEKMVAGSYSQNYCMFT